MKDSLLRIKFVLRYDLSTSKKAPKISVLFYWWTNGSRHPIEQLLSTRGFLPTGKAPHLNLINLICLFCWWRNGSLTQLFITGSPERNRLPIEQLLSARRCRINSVKNNSLNAAVLANLAKWFLPIGKADFIFI